MSKIDDLIAQYSPDGVEYKSIGDVCRTITDYVAAGSFADLAKKVKYNKDKDFAQLIRTTDLKSKFKGSNFIYVSEEAFKYLHKVNLDSESLILPNVGNCGEVYYIQPSQLPYENNVLGPNAILLRSDTENNRYLFHLFHGGEFQSKLKKITSPSGQSKFNKTELKKLFIPIPPLAVQEEIVSILDKFTALEAELEARTRQNKYYRNELLSFDGKDVEWKSLGDVGEFIRGSGLQKTDFRGSGVGCIHYGQIYTYYGTSATETKSFVSEELAKKLRKAKKGDLVIAGVSENIEDVCKAVVWLGEEDICISGDSWAYRHNQNPKYIGYLFQTNRFLEFKKKYAQGAKVTRLRSGSLPTFTIPVPPIEEQERIVAILDKFDALVNDISTGLPAEIQARRQQYEYYRGKLLTFEPLTA